MLISLWFAHYVFYPLSNTSAFVARMVDKGWPAHVGARGTPFGLNYHAEMFFTQQDGLSNYEVRCEFILPVDVPPGSRAATSSATITLGLDDSIGTLSSGKVAGFPANMNSLEGIRGTRQMQYVVRGGRVWNANPMVEVWSLKERKQMSSL